MLSIAKCQNLDYYSREVIDGREDYLSEAGAAPGRWTGRLAAADGLAGPAEREALAAAFAGQHPAGGALTAHPTAVTGFDLTLSPSKSVSLLWALGSPADAAGVEAALDAAHGQVRALPRGGGVSGPPRARRRDRRARRRVLRRGVPAPHQPAR